MVADPAERYGIPGKCYGEMDTAETVTALKAFWRDMAPCQQCYWWYVTLPDGQRIDLRADVAIYDQGAAWFKRRGQDVGYFPHVAAVVRATFA